MLALIVVSAVFKICLRQALAYPNWMAVALLFPFFGSLLFSGLNANDQFLWAKQTILLGAMLTLFAFVAQRWSRAQILQNLRWIIYPCSLIAGWGIIELVIFPANLQAYYYEYGLSLPRARALFAEANEFSQFLCLPFGFLLAALWYRKTLPLWERYAFYFGLVIVVIAQILTFSRGGLLAYASEVSAWIVLVVRYGTVRRRTPFWVKAILGIAISLIVGLSATSPTVATIAGVAEQRIEALFAGGDLTAAIRWETIGEVLSVSTDSFINLVFGIGFGNLPVILGEHSATTGNLLVDIVSETGLVGLLSFVCIAFAVLILPLRALELLIKARDEEMQAVFVGAYLSVVGVMVGGMTYATHMLNFFWFVCGLLFAFHHHRVVMARWSGRQRSQEQASSSIRKATA
jgi:hypothetical protein